MQAISGLFGGGDPKEWANKVKKDMRSECRTLDRQIRTIEREEAKIKKSVKAAAKRGDTDSAKALAKEIVNARKAVRRFHAAKAQMNSVSMQVQNQAAQAKMTGQIQKSTDVMKAMNKLTKVSEISAVMQDMQKELTKAGIIEEMTDDAFETLEGDGDEEEADSEVQKVLDELNTEIMAGSKSAPTKEVHQEEEAADDDDEEDEEELQKRLQQLKAT